MQHSTPFQRSGSLTFKRSKDPSRTVGSNGDHRRRRHFFLFHHNLRLSKLLHAVSPLYFPLFHKMIAHLQRVAEKIGAGGTGVPAQVTSVFFTRALLFTFSCFTISLVLPTCRIHSLLDASVLSGKLFNGPERSCR